MIRSAEPETAASAQPPMGTWPPALRFILPLTVLLLIATYWHSVYDMFVNWTMVDSYYSHGFLIPLISLFFVWRQRESLSTLSVKSSAWGYPVVLAAALLLVLGDFLGFRVFGQLSLLVMLAGLVLLFFGREVVKTLWFPLAFLVFMVPIPTSMTQGIALRLKLMAAEMAVALANALTLPMVQEGSWIHFGDDQLLIGEVCGGLRSLIALFAFGALMSHLSKTRNWARVLLLLLSAPIAIAANVFRIFLLCVIGYFWGSGIAAGKVHDVSGLLIFAVAFILFFAVEAFLRRVAPAARREEAAS